jgi:hypothetical protein
MQDKKNKSWYTSEPAVDYVYIPPVHITVFEPECDFQGVDSGLLDANGNKLYRYKKKKPLGFLSFDTGE